MRFHGYEQHSFWGNVDYPSNEAAKRARDEKAREAKKAGKRVKRSMLANQLRPYAGLGIPDGRIGNVYYVNVYDDEN